MATLVDIRDKVLRKAGLCVKSGVLQDESQLTARVLQPFAAADMAYALLKEVCEPKIGQYTVTQETKQLYKRAKHIYGDRIFNMNVGFLYGEMTQDEVCLFNDFMDKVSDSVQHDMQILHYQLQDHMMAVDVKDREKICKVLSSEILSLLAHDSLVIDLKYECPELKAVSKITHNIACSMLSKSGIAEIRFTDKMFEQTLTALFINITKVTTDGI